MAPIGVSVGYLLSPHFTPHQNKVRTFLLRSKNILLYLKCKQPRAVFKLNTPAYTRRLQTNIDHIL